MARAKRILWLTPYLTPSLEEKKKLLTQHNYNCQWVHSLEQLAEELSWQRSSMIIVSEGDSRLQAEEFILGLNRLGEAREARWLLCLHRHDPYVIELAVSSNFRDCLLMEMPDKLWLYRLLFASSSQALEFPLPAHQITLDHPAKLAFPCRLIWMNKDSLRFEGPISPPPGARLELRGRLLQHLGPEPTILTIRQLEHSHLSFRFSTACEADWQYPLLEQDEAFNRLQAVTSFLPAPRKKVFLAIKTAALRKDLLAYFTKQDYDINSALQLKSLIVEPPFYTPDLLLVEDNLCCPPHKDRFLKMLAGLAKDTPLIIVGSASEAKASLEDMVDSRFYFLPRFNSRQLDKILQKSQVFLEGTEVAPKPATHNFLATDNAHSCISIHMPARLQTVHPMAAHISCPYPIKTFALCQLSSPFLTKWLHRDPWFKITQEKSCLQPSAGLRPQLTAYWASGYFADLSPTAKQQLAKGISAFISKILGVANPSAPPSLSQEAAIKASPLASVKEVTAQAMPATAAPLPAPALPPLRTPMPASPSQLYQKLKASHLIPVFFALLASLLLLGLSVFLVQRWAANFDKSGSVYIDQLKKFSSEKTPTP